MKGNENKGKSSFGMMKKAIPALIALTMLYLH